LHRAPQNVPAELYPDFSTIEYLVPPKRPVAPPAYVFVVDTCIPEDELAACRQALAQALASMPEYAQARPRPVGRRGRRALLWMCRRCTCAGGRAGGRAGARARAWRRPLRCALLCKRSPWVTRSRHAAGPHALAAAGTAREPAAGGLAV